MINLSLKMTSWESDFRFLFIRQRKHCASITSSKNLISCVLASDQLETMAPSKIVIRSILLYEFKLGTSARGTASRLCRFFGKDTISDRSAQYWFANIRSGDESLEDEAKSGRPSEFDEDALKQMIEETPTLTC